MAQNAFYVLDMDPPAYGQSQSQDSDAAPNGPAQPPAAFGFATHPLNIDSGSRNNHSSRGRGRSLVPLYFDPNASVGGLVCGLQENTKNLVLANILHSSLVPNDSRPPANVLCFTAQNGSRNIVSAVASLPESISRDTQIIILTAPRNVSKMRGVHQDSPRTSVYPLLIQEEDIQLGHLIHLTAGESLDSATGPSPGVLSGFKEVNAMFSYSEFIASHGLDRYVAGQEDLLEHISYPSTKRVQKNLPPLPEWVGWLKGGQKPLAPGSTGVSSSEVTNQTSRLILCIDWTGIFPQEQRLISVLGDIVLTYWLKYCQGVGRPGTAIVCDQAQDYLQNHSPGPFIRKLLQLVSSSSFANPTVAQYNGTNSQNAIHKLPTMNYNLVLLAENPTRLPANLLDHLSFLIIHRFTSPSWLKSLDEHFFLPFSREGGEGTAQHDTSQEVTKNSSHTMLQIFELEPKEVMLFAPRNSKSNARSSVGTVRTNNVTNGIPASANITNNTDNNTATTKKGLGHQWVKIKLSNGQDGQDGLDGSGTPVSTPRDLAFPSSATSSGSMNSTGAFNVNSDPILNSNILRRGPSPNPNGFNLLPPKSSRTAYTSPTPAPQTSPPTWGLGALTPSTNSSNTMPMPMPAPGSITLLAPPVENSIRDSGSMGSSFFITSPGVISRPNTNRLSPPSPGPRSLSTGSNSGSVAYSSQYALSPSSPVGASGGFSPFITSRSFGGLGGAGGDHTLSSSYAAGGGGGGHVRMGLPSSYIDGSNMTNVNSDVGGFGFGGLSRPSYRDATAREGEVTIQRRDTAVPGVGERYAYHPGAPTPGAAGAAGTSTSSSVSAAPQSDGSGLDASSPVGPSPPPVYPESFFWPLLDALERARAQVSTPHNRAQSVRHSVVGQELPQSQRQRLQLTFKEYVAAAARTEVVVTGDSGDKAWIALREWKYPGKNAGSHVVRINPR